MKGNMFEFLWNKSGKKHDSKLFLRFIRVFIKRVIKSLFLQSVTV